MTNPYDDYAVDLIDISKYNDKIETEYKPTLDEVVAAGFLGVGVRVGLGRVKDRMFDWFWQKAKGRLQRKGYWYGDYYSHKSLGISGRAWGIEQGQNWAKYQGGDWGEIPGALDCEPSPVGGAITAFNRKAYNEVMRPIAETYDAITGGTCEIYCSPGFIPNLYEWARKRTLWVAWYDRNKTKAQIIAECRTKGWLGEIKIWQYASDGDLNVDGVRDGLSLGMETETLDLNAWLGTLSEWSQYCGSTPPIVTPPVEDPPVVVPPASSQMKVIAIDGLNIRNTPKNLSGSYVYSQNGTMPCGTVVDILETKVIGYDVWHRIGYMQWCAERYNGTTFLGGV